MIRKLKNIGRIIRTVSHLKLIQVAYQFKYRLVPAKSLSAYSSENSAYRKLKFFQTPEISLVKLEENKFQFTFLNLTQTFKNQVDWNFQDFGKLWNYNLQYFDWLKQSSLEIDVKNTLALSLYRHLWDGNLILEPYPASLRIMNAIRYLSVFENADQSLATFIKSETNFLINRLEYHLLANHLLENAFAVYMAGSFFNEQKWIQLGEKLLREELDEQILGDGAHFELSPMYHQIIFFRVLEFLTYEHHDSDLYALVKQKATKMLSWLKKITFKNGEIPHFNDSTNGIAPSSSQLFDIAAQIGLKEELNHVLKDSGYRKFVSDNFELVIDVHGISPSYQPGHTHADTFTFCLNHNDKPIFVDTGLSTYNISDKRNYERSTAAHNTLTINDCNSAEVWSGFRVGRRLNVNILKEDHDFLILTHNGFKKFGKRHSRQLSFKGNTAEIVDRLDSKDEFDIIAKSYLHLHPNVSLMQLEDNLFIINDNVELKITGHKSVIIEKYEYCVGYNSYQTATRIVIVLKESKLKTLISQIK